MTQCTIFDSATGERYVIQTSTPPPRRTIKRAEDILERLKIPLPPSCSQPCSVHVEDRTLHVFLTYAAILMYNVTLNNQHRGMTQFKSLLPNTKTPAALCPWLTEFKHCSSTRGFLISSSTVAALIQQPHMNWSGARGLKTVALQQEISIFL